MRGKKLDWICAIKRRDILKSLVKVTNVTGVETVACKPVSTPGSASSPEFSTKILEQKSFCTFRDPILRDRTIRLTNIMTDWSKQRKGGAARRLAGLWAGFVEETFHVLDARLCQANCPRAKGDRGQFATNTLIRGKLIRPTCKWTESHFSMLTSQSSYFPAGRNWFTFLPRSFNDLFRIFAARGEGGRRGWRIGWAEGNEFTERGWWSWSGGKPVETGKGARIKQMLHLLAPAHTCCVGNEH